MAREVNQVLRAYIRGQLLLAAVIGAVTYVSVLALGLRYALLLAVVAGVLEVVPVIGPILAAIPAILLALFQPEVPFGLANWMYALIVAAVYALIQQLENNLLVPNIVGRSVNLHPVVVLFGVVAGANLAGVFGVFLSVPALATVRIVARYAGRWIRPAEVPG
jgi:predicted PurR-regulated permease PerM